MLGSVAQGRLAQINIHNIQDPRCYIHDPSRPILTKN